jgi:hypothetical protein
MKTKYRRVYTRVYMGVMKENVDYEMINLDLLSQGKPGLVMQVSGRNVFPVAKQVFRSATTPTEKTHHYFRYVVGPFRTARAAHYMANNPYVVCVAEAERLSKSLLQLKKMGLTKGYYNVVSS